jgi:hypothetical protein
VVIVCSWSSIVIDRFEAVGLSFISRPQYFMSAIFALEMAVAFICSWNLGTR